MFSRSPKTRVLDISIALDISTVADPEVRYTSAASRPCKAKFKFRGHLPSAPSAQWHAGLHQDLAGLSSAPCPSSKCAERATVCRSSSRPDKVEFSSVSVLRVRRARNSMQVFSKTLQSWIQVLRPPSECAERAMACTSSSGPRQ